MLTELHCPAKWQENKIRRNNSRVTLSETHAFKKKQKKKSVDESSAGPSRGLSHSSPQRILDVTLGGGVSSRDWKGAAEGSCLNRSAHPIAKTSHLWARKRGG